MPEITPGPWHVGGRWNDDVKAGGVIVCQVYSAANPRETNEANARAIAQVPVMIGDLIEPLIHAHRTHVSAEDMAHSAVFIAVRAQQILDAIKGVNDDQHS